MFRILLLISTLFANSASAETAEENRAFACFAVGDMEFMSDNLSMNANLRPVVAEFWKEGSQIELTTATGSSTPLQLSPEKAELTLDQLLAACEQQIRVLPRRTPTLVAAFATKEGLSCSKKGQGLQLSDNPDKYAINMSAVTGFDKKSPDQLTILIDAESRAITLTPLQAELPLDQLLAGCWLEADVIRRPILAKAD
jgi:hypothetical protein